MSGIREIKLLRSGGDDEPAAALGNNVAWNCSCPRTAPLLGSLMIGKGEIKCPDCGKRYMVEAEGTRAVGVREMPTAHDKQKAAEEAVVRAALNSIWNSYGGDKVADDGPHGIVCKTAACGLDQGIISCVSGWDEDDVFEKSLDVQDHKEVARAAAIIAAVRRVVDRGVKDGILEEVPNSTRYSLGVTFVSGKEL